jgi:prepilin-type N-terminal cleavage/methylation domain-containing protein
VSNKLGFSLIELLVATAIMTMVLLISSMGYSFFMDRWTNERTAFERVASQAKKLILTREAVQGFYPYILRAENGEPVIYFEGNTDSLIGVTGKSMFINQQMAIVRLRIEQNEDFLYRLIYEEYPLQQKTLTTLTQEFEFEYRATLLSGMKEMSFQYFGARNLEAYVNSSERQWWTTFNALSRKVMPELIRINYVQDAQTESMDFSVSQLDTRQLALFEEEAI